MTSHQTLLSQAVGLLGGDAGRGLPFLATRKALHAHGPHEVRAPHSVASFAALTNRARRDHVARWALQLVADFGAPVAASVVLGHVEATARAVDAAVSKQASRELTQHATSAAETAPMRASYVVACARGCGHWSPARGPHAVVIVTPDCRASKRSARRARMAARREVAE